MKRAWLLLILSALTVLTITACSPQKQESQPKPYKQWDKPPAMQINPNKTYIAHVDTNKGKFSIELFAKDAPKTVNNFVFLAREKFYDGLTFHRIVKDFVIQGGDPEGNGTGGPGYTFEDELSRKHQYVKGVVAMANPGPNRNGSQFFIGNGPRVEVLNTQPDYTIFGKVIQGMDTVEKISNVPVKQDSRGEMNIPLEKVTINKITIEEK
jgi:cyclophilin family peptidyl-prolyl cis-trans isomerase